MNQMFKKKMVVAGVTAAFAAVGAGFVAVPGLASMGVASANLFEDTTQAAATSTGVNVSVGTSVVANNQTITITESSGAALGPAGASGGILYLALDGGAKFAAGTKIGVKVSGGLTLKTMGGTTLSQTSGASGAADAPYSLLSGDIDSSGRIPLVVATQSSVGSPSFIALTNITMNTSGSSVGSNINVSIASASTAVGVTTGTNTYVATVSSKGATIALDSTSTNNVAGGQTLTMTQINVSETVPGSFSNNTSTGDVTITLNGGYTWATKPTMANNSGSVDPVTGSTTTTGLSTGNSSSVASYSFAANLTASTTGTDKIKFSGGKVFIPAGSATGNVTATVKFYSSNAVVTQTELVIGAIVAKGTTATFVENDGTSATVDYNTCFTGRTYASLAGCVGGESDKLKVAELVAGSLAKDGTLTLALSNGVKFADAGTTNTDDGSSGLVTGTETVATDSKSASYTIGTASSSGAGNTVITFGGLDFTSATAGDFKVTVGGTAGASAADIKMAEVVAATNASVASGLQTVTAGSVFTIPEISVKEGKYGALIAADNIGISMPSGYTIQKSSGDTVSGDTLTNGTDVTVKVYDASGADVTTAAIGSSPTLTVKDGGSGTPRQLFITVSGASNSTSKEYTYKITGLKVKSSASATSGPVTATLGGQSTGGGAASTVAAMGAEDADKWTSKSSATKQTITVATIGSATNGTPSSTVTGSITSQQINVGYVPAGNDLGKQGSVFIAAVVPASSGIGGVYFMDGSKNWTLYSTCTTAPAYSTGTLATLAGVDLLAAATNLSVLKGTVIYVGHGVGGALSPAGTACNNMLTNGTYASVLTIN